MIRGCLQNLVTLVALAAIAYVTFFIPLGQRTLWEHLMRIASTPEARELGHEATQAGKRLGESMLREGDASARDAGVPDAARGPGHGAQ